MKTEVFGITVYENEITEFLKNLLDVPEWFSPYFMGREKAFENEKQKYGENISVCVFRSLGYTVGHVVIDDNWKIIKFVVYDRNKVQDYKISHSELESLLNEKFAGKTLKLED